MAYGFPRYGLNANQRTWLAAYHTDFIAGIIPNPPRKVRQMKKSNQIGRAFDPDVFRTHNQFGRILIKDNMITLCGILELNPDSDVPGKIEKLILYIKGQIEANPETFKRAEFSTISAAISTPGSPITDNEISSFYHLLSRMGPWFDSAAGTIPPNLNEMTLFSAVEIDTDRVMTRYERFVAVEDPTRPETYTMEGLINRFINRLED